MSAKNDLAFEKSLSNVRKRSSFGKKLINGLKRSNF